MNEESSLHLSYSYDAPVSLVYAHWTEPELLSTWWGVRGSAVVDCRVDLRVGGRWSIAMQTRDGRVYQNQGVYLEIEPFQRLKFSDIPIADLPEWEGVLRNPAIHTVTFKATAGRTVVDLRVQFETVAERNLIARLGMPEGISQGLQRLAEVLGGALAD